jgi:hypothetical protein
MRTSIKSTSTTFAGDDKWQETAEPPPPREAVDAGLPAPPPLTILDPQPGSSNAEWGLTSAVVGKLKLPRCAATLQLLPDKSWLCAVCRSHYCEGGSCVSCGAPLRRVAAMPALQTPLLLP